MAITSVICASEIAEAVAKLYCRISTHLRPDVRAAIEAALEREESDVARQTLLALLANEQTSRASGVPLCQDTGLVVAFVRMGARVAITGGTLQKAVDEGVRRAARDHPMRASSVVDPLERRNPGDNAPAVVHLEHVEGEELALSLMAKGGGAENMSRIFMLTPGRGRQGVIEAVVETVRRAGANACPPLIVGVGLGGNFERSAILSKKALLRDLAQPNADGPTGDLEAEILERVNALGIGPQGFGGHTTALAVLIERSPCHIASLPVAVNLECHSHRHGTVVLGGKGRADG
jgi:fumarate hydratase subunit alpha